MHQKSDYQLAVLCEYRYLAYVCTDSIDQAAQHLDDSIAFETARPVARPTLHHIPGEFGAHASEMPAQLTSNGKCVSDSKFGYQ